MRVKAEKLELLPLRGTAVPGLGGFVPEANHGSSSLMPGIAPASASRTPNSVSKM